MDRTSDNCESCKKLINFTEDMLKLRAEQKRSAKPHFVIQCPYCKTFYCVICRYVYTVNLAEDE